MKKKVIITQEVIVDIPDNKLDDTLAGYKEIIDANGSTVDLFTHIAYNYAINCAVFVDGIGDIKTIGDLSVYGKPESKISVERDRDLIDMETEDL